MGITNLNIIPPRPNMAVYPDAREASHVGLLSVVARR